VLISRTRTGVDEIEPVKAVIDELKFDKTFVTGMARDPSDAVIVRSTIDLAHNMGLAVVPEGVEGEATFDQLRALGCDMVQGYGHFCGARFRTAGVVSVGGPSSFPRIVLPFQGIKAVHDDMLQRINSG
jgi:predicted signal transduction protein with EAL and GGDEF domain